MAIRQAMHCTTLGVVLGTVTWGTATLLKGRMGIHKLRGERTLATGLLGIGVLHTLGAGINPTSRQQT